MVDNRIDRAFSKQARSILRQLVEAEHHPRAPPVACSAAVTSGGPTEAL